MYMFVLTVEMNTKVMASFAQNAEMSLANRQPIGCFFYDIIVLRRWLNGILCYHFITDNCWALFYCTKESDGDNWT